MASSRSHSFRTQIVRLLSWRGRRSWMKKRSNGRVKTLIWSRCVSMSPEQQIHRHSVFAAPDKRHHSGERRDLKLHPVAHSRSPKLTLRPSDASQHHPQRCWLQCSQTSSWRRTNNEMSGKSRRAFVCNQETSGSRRAGDNKGATLDSGFLRNLVKGSPITGGFKEAPLRAL